MVLLCGQCCWGLDAQCKRLLAGAEAMHSFQALRESMMQVQLVAQPSPTSHVPVQLKNRCWHSAFHCTITWLVKEG